MGLITDRLALLITADADQAIREIGKVGDRAEKDLGKATAGIDRFGATATKVGAGMVGFSAVVGAGLFGAARASEEANRSNLLLQNTLTNMPKLAGETADAFEDQADALQLVTAADGDAIKAAQAMLGTFNLTGAEIRGVTPLVVDYARKFGVDLTGAAIQVGKALDGQIGALKRNGVSIDENLFKTDRFAAVTQALRDQVGGFAEEEGKTFSGQLQILKNNLGDVQEGVGTGVVSAFNSAVGPVSKLALEFKNLDPELQSNIGKFLTIGTAAIGAIGGLSLMAGTLTKMRDSLHDSAGALNNFGRAAQGLGIAGAIGAAVVGIQALGTALQDAISKPKVEALTRDMIAMADGVDGAGKQFRDNARYVDQFVAALKRPGTSSHELRSWIDEVDKALVALVTGGAPEKARAAIEALAAELDQPPEKILPFLDDYAKALETSKTAAAVAEAAVDETAGAIGESGEAAEEAAPKLDPLEQAFKDLGDATKGASDKAKAFKTIMDELLGAPIDAEEALIRYRDAVQSLGDSLVENGGIFDFDSDAGRKNLRALQEAVEAAKSQLVAMQEGGATTGQLQAALNEQRTGIINTLRHYGFAERDILGLLAKYGLTDTNLTPVFNAGGQPNPTQSTRVVRGDDFVPVRRDAPVINYYNTIHTGADPEAVRRATFLDESRNGGRPRS